MEGISVTVDMVRSALQGFCSGGEKVSTRQLIAALGLECEAEKARLRKRLNDMVHHGEVKRVEAGVFEYNFSHRPRNPQSFSKIWRFVRHAKPGWSFSTAALMTHLSYTQVSRYCAWLEDEDYICRSGRDGQTILYQATRKADAHPGNAVSSASGCRSFRQGKGGCGPDSPAPTLPRPLFQEGGHGRAGSLSNPAFQI